MTDEDALRKAILANPEDDTVRLAYADFLEERDTSWVSCDKCDGTGMRPYCSRFMYGCAELGIDPCECGSRKRCECEGGLVVDEGLRDRGEFIRVQVELARTPEPHYLTVGGIRLPDDPARYEHGVCERCGEARPGRCHFHTLFFRQRELFQCVYSDGLPGPFVPNLDGWLGRDSPHAHYRRGFCEAVTCSGEEWLRYHWDLTWHPAQTIKCPECVGDPPTGWYYKAGSCPDCSGVGRVPRPLPTSAQPVTRVRLHYAPVPQQDADHVWYPGLGRIPKNDWPTGGSAVLIALGTYWPWVSFELDGEFQPGPVRSNERVYQIKDPPRHDLRPGDWFITHHKNLAVVAGPPEGGRVPAAIRPI